MKLSDFEDKSKFTEMLQWREHGDGTADVSRDGGKTWTRERFPIQIDDRTMISASGVVTGLN